MNGSNQRALLRSKISPQMLDPSHCAASVSNHQCQSNSLPRTMHAVEHMLPATTRHLVTKILHPPRTRAAGLTMALGIRLEAMWGEEKSVENLTFGSNSGVGHCWASLQRQIRG